MIRLIKSRLLALSQGQLLAIIVWHVLVVWGFFLLLSREIEASTENLIELYQKCPDGFGECVSAPSDTLFWGTVAVIALTWVIVIALSEGGDDANRD